MASESERDSYPFWVAMGAACVGTLLGGGAVWLGVAKQFDRLEGQLASQTSQHGPAKPEPEPGESVLAEPDRPAKDLALRDEALALESAGADTSEDPGDSSLVRAIDVTRESVVTIELGGAPAGAGVLYDGSGTLLTNYHVIAPALRAPAVLGDAVASLTVRFVDGRERKARVLAADPDEDVAILGVELEHAESFAAAPLGHSSGLRLGEQVFAIGSPVGFEGTVATGIISALQRTDVLPNRQLPVLQLDAAINFGNSGGPLFNLAGEIVGITTARSSRGEGIGFAIPIDRIRLFLQALEQGIRGRSGVIGVSLDTNQEIAATIDPLGYHSGVLVDGVDEKGAAALAGMRAGDVIVTLRGLRHDELDSSKWGRAAFAKLVGETIRGLLPGETLTVELVRAGELVQVEVVVEAASIERQARIDAEVLLGLVLAEGDEGAHIEGLVTSSPIARMRGVQILAGAQIVSVFGQPVADLAQLGERLVWMRSWSAGRGRRSISMEFMLADGRNLRANNYPLADAR